MKISLNFPTGAIEKMKRMGFEPVTPEELSWAEGHPNRKNADGVVLRGEENKLLDGVTFAALINNFGAWIEVDSKELQSKIITSVASDDADTAKSVKLVTA